jgi:hypothetical protein
MLRDKLIVAFVVVLFCLGTIIFLVSEPANQRQNFPTGKPIAGLSDPDELTLYSLDGVDEFEVKYREALAKGSETLGRYAVLGKLPVTDAESRREIVAMLQDAIVNHEGYVGIC